ncbi:MBL fold metallo-hydrolase [Rhodobacteraceae bacterium]|nr:MBL fold metallo-hydrolase [Paracoccaceae bacterium]
MPLSRRRLLTTAAAASLVPAGVKAQANGPMMQDEAGRLQIHPTGHASFVMQTQAGVLYLDPVGDLALYADLPPPDLILVTHEHPDNFSVDTLTSLSEKSGIISNLGAFAKMTGSLQDRTVTLSNGGGHSFGGVTIEALPAYNLTPDRRQYHPRGRDNGYLLTLPGPFRVYISGDTEDIREMRGLRAIDIAFVSMNLPYTMDIFSAASAVNQFKPRMVAPYHLREKGGDATQDPREFAKLVGDHTQVQIGGWR